MVEDGCMSVEKTIFRGKTVREPTELDKELGAILFISDGRAIN